MGTGAGRGCGACGSFSESAAAGAACPTSVVGLGIEPGRGAITPIGTRCGAAGGCGSGATPGARGGGGGPAWKPGDEIEVDERDCGASISCSWECMSALAPSTPSARTRIS